MASCVLWPQQHGPAVLLRRSETMTGPVSWLQISPGWTVVGSDGELVGTVLSVGGDKPRDIFNGLAIRVGESPAPHYVTAENVASLRPGEVTLRLTGAEADRLELFEQPPPVTVWRPTPPSRRARLSNWLRGKR